MVPRTEGLMSFTITCSNFSTFFSWDYSASVEFHMSCVVNRTHQLPRFTLKHTSLPQLSEFTCSLTEKVFTLLLWICYRLDTLFSKLSTRNLRRIWCDFYFQKAESYKHNKATVWYKIESSHCCGSMESHLPICLGLIFRGFTQE